ncbi:3D domain-containing protein [Bacillus songklensis]|uniref:3D domain-containing protein n=1 Tax=Bacillus songklensis TaxID=1069116 RepID=A0ABV8B5D3_9BACI
MQLIRRMVLTMLVSLLGLSGTIAAHAQTSQETLKNAQQRLQQKQAIVNQKVKEKQSVNQDIKKIQQELQSLHTLISKNKEDLTKIQQKIEATNRLIEQKKAEIVVLEDKVLARKHIMKERLVALQRNDNRNILIDMFLDADSLADFIRRASAVTTLFNADKDILAAQQEDLRQIEEDKKEIDRQEQILESEQEKLAVQQAELDQNLQKRQAALAAMQVKYSQISKQIALAEQEKASIESQMKEIQEAIKKEQEEARERAAKAAMERAAKEKAARETRLAEQARAKAAARAKVAASRPSPSKETSGKEPTEGKEMYVTATAYSHEETDGNGYITALGYNIKNDPSLKLIAVDPDVIPLGKKVWVERYGVAIAGDTGGAIKGHRIDVLMHSKADALAWGRQTVKVVILD